MRLDRGGGQAGTRCLALFQQTGNLTCQIPSLSFSSCGPTAILHLAGMTKGGGKARTQGGDSCPGFPPFLL